MESKLGMLGVVGKLVKYAFYLSKRIFLKEDISYFVGCPSRK
jgi:hypothetical protein